METKLTYGFDALEAAFDRIPNVDPHRRFAPLAEALMWIVIINDVFWANDEEGYRAFRSERFPTMEALRYARHRLIHDEDVTGLHEGVLQTGVLGTDPIFRLDPSVSDDEMIWRWRALDGLPPAANKDGEQLYESELQGRDVSDSLLAAATFLKQYWSERFQPVEA